MADPRASHAPHGAPPPELVERAAQALREGALVGLPTETVYGIAARADRPQSIGALRALKGREGERPFTLHLSDPDVAERFATWWLAPARKLVKRYWPGPLTLVVPASPAAPEVSVRAGEPSRWVGVRVPASELTRAVLRAVDAPVAMTSANRSGEPAASALRDVPAAMREALAVALDDPRPTLAQASTVVRVGPGLFQVEREGILSADDLRRAAGRRVLFVCTGNTCRSPMAEAYLKAQLADTLGGARDASPAEQSAFLERFGYAVASAGIAPLQGSPASRHAQTVAAELGLSLAGHRAEELTVERLAAFDVVLAMSERHVERVRELAPSANVEALVPGTEIADPFGGPVEAYRESFDRIREAIDQRLPEM